MNQSKGWLRGVISKADSETTGPPVTIYERGIQDLTADIARAQERVDMAVAARAQADDELARAQQAFIDHCKGIDLPLDISPTLYPPKPYNFED